MNTVLAEKRFFPPSFEPFNLRSFRREQWAMFIALLSGSLPTFIPQNKLMIDDQ
jgi:hypothetical protein